MIRPPCRVLSRRFAGWDSHRIVANAVDFYQSTKTGIVISTLPQATLNFWFLRLRETLDHRPMPVPAGFTTADAFRNTIELARLADRLGYERYWIAEHHATGAFASPAPEILIARVAAETSHIRVGSGGVMLPHYSPMKVAESFRVLHALYPGRIDLGIGRAPGAARSIRSRCAAIATRQQAEDDFPSNCSS